MDASQLEVTCLSRLLAVEVLLAEPEELGDDILETCLYILRDRLRGTDDGQETSPDHEQTDDAKTRKLYKTAW